MRKTVAAVFLAIFLFCAAPALAWQQAASLSPGIWEIKAAYEAGQAYRISVRSLLDVWPDLTDGSFGYIKGLAESLGLIIHLQQTQSGSLSAGKLAQAEADWLLFSALEGSDRTSFTLEAPDNLPATCYLGSPETPPWEMLLGAKPYLPDPAHAGSVLRELSEWMLPTLLPYEKPVKTSITIKNAGRSKSQLVYTVKAEEAQELWDSHQTRWLPLLRQALGSLLPSEQAQALGDGLESLSFTRTLTIKRFLDDEGSDLGVQITGTMETGGTARKLTLFSGQSADGFYLSLKFPATRGNDTLEVQVSLKTNAGKWVGDCRVRIQVGKEVTNLTGKLDLTGQTREEGETLSGEISLRVVRTGSRKSTVDWRFAPSLLMAEGGLTGELLIQELKGKTVRRQLTLAVEARQVDEVVKPLALSEVDVPALNPQQLKLEQARAQSALMPRLREWIMGVPMEDRRVLLHDLGRDALTRGESVPPLEYVDPDMFTVVEPITTQEDTP